MSWSHNFSPISSTEASSLALCALPVSSQCCGTMASGSYWCCPGHTPVVPPVAFQWVPHVVPSSGILPETEQHEGKSVLGKDNFQESKALSPPTSLCQLVFSSREKKQKGRGTLEDSELPSKEVGAVVTPPSKDQTFSHLSHRSAKTSPCHLLCQPNSVLPVKKEVM